MSVKVSKLQEENTELKKKLAQAYSAHAALLLSFRRVFWRFYVRIGN